MTEESRQRVELLLKYAIWSGSLEADSTHQCFRKARGQLHSAGLIHTTVLRRVSKTNQYIFILAKDDTEEDGLGNVRSNDEIKISGRRSLDVWAY